MTFFLAPALTFAQWLDWKRLLRRLTEVERWLLKEIRLYLFFLSIYWFIDLFIYLFIHSFINLWKIVHSTGVYFPYKEVYRWIIRYLDHNFFFFFLDYFKVSIHLITASVQGKIRNKREKRDFLRVLFISAMDTTAVNSIDPQVFQGFN